MATLYVTSSEKGSGKTGICAGLAKQLAAKGKKIGFLKPVSAAAGADSDARFMKQLLSLSETVDILCPVIKWGSNLSAGIKDAYAKVSHGKDVVIVEGISEQFQATRDIATALNAKVLIVETYSKEPLKSIDSYKRFGQSLLGVILNKVPQTRMEQVQKEAAARLSQAGVNLLGLLPEDRTLLALTVGELAEGIGGEILPGGEGTQLVENLMLGALGLDPGPEYFGRKANKAAILRSDRPDVQMAALQTSTCCLVLGGSTPLNPVVLNEAKRKGVAIILSGESVPALTGRIETVLVKARFNQLKVSRLVEIMERQLNLQKICQGLGLAG